MSAPDVNTPPIAKGVGKEPYDEEDFTDSADEWEVPVRGREGDDSKDDAAAATKVPEHLTGIEKELLGEAVPVTFVLPDGTRLESTFYMGQTIEYLKAYLEKQRPGELGYEKTSLYLGEKMLLDPLSLNDLPFQAGERNEIKVVVA